MVSKCNDFSLGNEERKLVFACIAEGTELDAVNFRANCGSELFRFCARREEIRKRSVSGESVFDVRKGL